uniref:Uncharacterized protein n=1 Tax=Avena sativa TaxID=4498 RepID=A0ACD5WNU8_AVESA
MKTFPLAIWGIIASVLVGILVFAANKKWDLGSHPFRLGYRVDALVHVISTLCKIRADIDQDERQPYSHLSMEWHDSLIELEIRYKEIKDGYDGCRLYSLFKLCSIGMRAGEELVRAKDLMAEGLHLRGQVLARAVLIEKNSNYPQDPSQEMRNSCKNKVLEFIRQEGAMYGVQGIWGLNVKANSSLLTEVRNTPSELLVCGVPAIVVLHVKAGRGCTLARLKKAIAQAMAPKIQFDEIHDRQTIQEQIHDRLRDKSFVLLLDDLWDSIDLKAAGIPELEPRDGQVQRHRRKVVFTTSTSCVCARMGCRDDRIIELECFNKVVDHPGMMGSYLKVVDFLKSDNKHRMLRIWGMGGVGKSTLLNLVDFYRPLFHDDTSLLVLYVEAGKTCTVAKVQKYIVDACTLDKNNDEKSQSNIIHDHLKDKSFLFLVDDLWGSLDLEAVGIPGIEDSPDIEPQHWRKVVFTTRSSNVCCLIKKPHGNTTELRMERLTEQDAWKLFTRVVGNDFNDRNSRIYVHAKEIVEECGGLPDALKQSGQFLSTRTEDCQWETYLDDFKRSKLPEITENRLKSSYDDIEDGIKKCLLICSLWTENENIPMEKLIRWWIGLGYLDVPHVNRGLFKKKVNRGYSIIHELLGSSMLEKGDNTGLQSSENSHVKIHNIMRKMSLGNKHHGICLPHSSRRSALEEEEWYPVQKLTMFVARHAFSLERITCFKLITFLDLEGTTSAILFTVICELSKLQYLNLSSTSTAALTKDLENLPYLKYLYIRHNKKLRTIQEGLIEKLEELRGLDLYCSGAIPDDYSSLLDELVVHAKHLRMLGFTVQKRVDITKLCELKKRPTLSLCMYHFEVESPSNIINLELLASLENLRELAIMERSDNPNGIQSDIQNDCSRNDIQNEDRQINIQNGGQNDIQNDCSRNDIQNEDRQINIQNGGQNDIQNGGQNDIQNDCSRNDIQNDDGQTDIQNGSQNDIQNDGSKLDTQNDGSRKYIQSDDGQIYIRNDIQNDGSQIDTQNDGREKDIQNGRQNELVAELVIGGGDQWLFPDMDFFKLDNLHMLKKVTWKNAGRNIKVVDIHDCGNLKDVTWVHQLGFFEQLTVVRCPIMEKLIDIGMDEMVMTLGFPKLKKLSLEELPQLSLISTQACNVDGLSYVWVHQCSELKDIEILKSNNQNMIRIDCDQDWWKSLRITPPYFNPTFTTNIPGKI